MPIFMSLPSVPVPHTIEMYGGPIRIPAAFYTNAVARHMERLAAAATGEGR